MPKKPNPLRYATVVIEPYHGMQSGRYWHLRVGFHEWSDDKREWHSHYHDNRGLVVHGQTDGEVLDAIARGDKPESGAWYSIEPRADAGIATAHDLKRLGKLLSSVDRAMEALTLARGVSADAADYLARLFEVTGTGLVSYRSAVPLGSDIHTRNRHQETCQPVTVGRFVSLMRSDTARMLSIVRESKVLTPVAE